MTIFSLCILLDTNVYILGTADSKSPEAQILSGLEPVNSTDGQFEILISEPLLDQITRVAKRLVNKDWAGKIVDRVFSKLITRYVFMTDDEIEYWLEQRTIPREDIEVYLTAKNGNAQCFVSTNHELIRAIVQQTHEFECLTPEEFVKKYLSSESNLKP
jgi:predicted nucleic acid-binding protein